MAKSPTDTQDQMREIAWLHYIAGLTQSEIATRRGLSKMKVHRLVQAAQDQGLVRVFVDNVPSDCLDLENALMDRYGLTTCHVVPDGGLPQSMDGTMPVVANAGARFLHGRLDSKDPMILGIGSGRTMAEVVKLLPAIRRRNAEFISVTGDFATLSDANPFEVIHILIAKTEGNGYAVTAPLVVDSEDDKHLFLRQKAIRNATDRLANANLIFVGLGHVGPGSFLKSFGLLSDPELSELAQQDVAADLAGNLLNSEGEFVDTGISRRMIGIDRALLSTREVVAIASGIEKWRAARAVLRNGCLDGLITSRSLAERVVTNP